MHYPNFTYKWFWTVTPKEWLIKLSDECSFSISAVDWLKMILLIHVWCMIVKAENWNNRKLAWESCVHGWLFSLSLLLQSKLSKLVSHHWNRWQIEKAKVQLRNSFYFTISSCCNTLAVQIHWLSKVVSWLFHKPHIQKKP